MSIRLKNLNIILNNINVINGNNNIIFTRNTHNINNHNTKHQYDVFTETGMKDSISPYYEIEDACRLSLFLKENFPKMKYVILLFLCCSNCHTNTLEEINTYYKCIENNILVFNVHEYNSLEILQKRIFFDITYKLFREDKQADTVFATLELNKPSDFSSFYSYINTLISSLSLDKYKIQASHSGGMKNRKLHKKLNKNKSQKTKINHKNKNKSRKQK